MPIVPPLLDDRTWKDLRDEALARVPIYTPEWTDLRPGDPGVTIVELFAYLTEALIYRLNRVPDNNYLAFLNLLDAQPRAAEPARGLVQLAINAATVASCTVVPDAKLSAGKVKFAATNALTVLPVDTAGFLKCRTPAPRKKSDQEAFARSALKAFVGGQLDKLSTIAPVHFVTRAYPPTDGSVLPLSRAMDGALWIAVLLRDKDYQTAKASAVLLAAKKDEVRKVLGHQILTLGVSLASLQGRTCTACEAPPEDTGGNRAVDGLARTRWRWQITAPAGIPASPTALGWTQQPSYASVALVDDTTDGLRHDGVVKLQLPDYALMVAGKPSSPEQQLATWDQMETPPDPTTGTTRLVPLAAYPRAGDLPPLLDDGDLEKRVVFWLRALPREATDTEQAPKRPKVNYALQWIGPNAVDVVQAIKQSNEAIGVGKGQPSQQFTLAFNPVLTGTLTLTVFENGAPATWCELDNFDAADDRTSGYVLDRALGLVTVGDGLQGRVVPDGAPLYATYQYGGGLAGNLPPGAISKLEAPTPPEIDPGKTTNPVATAGGSETETVDQARRRVPMILRHQNRAVTADDFRELAQLTPGVAVGRAEVLPLFRPSSDPAVKFPGVVTVLVVPAEDPVNPSAPEPDRAFRQAVCNHLDQHRLITTELFVIGPRYVKLAVSVGVKPKPGTRMEQLNQWVCLALHQYLAPLAPFGPDGQGWPLGGKVNRAAIEAAVLQVSGVAWVEELQLFRVFNDGTMTGAVESIDLRLIDLPALTQIAVGAGTAPPLSAGPATDKVLVPVPVPRTAC
ncbi:MAG TPA: putative baseplate assembly protein [Kofleriaceae bacterium]|jgi:hypothetical protein|nr:putative baseplate assembly protein [Kofleriaceae bacterium]